MSRFKKDYYKFIIDDFERSYNLHKSCESCMPKEDLMYKYEMCHSALVLELTYCYDFMNNEEDDVIKYLRILENYFDEIYTMED